jgi:hypothetical protein
MRTVTSLGCAALLTALAASVGAEEVELTSTLDQACTFTGDLTGEVPPVPNVIHDVGFLGFSCNYAGTVNIGMTTADGTILQVPGEPESGVQYQIRWVVPPINPNLLWNSSVAAATFGPWTGNTAATPNEVSSHVVQVRFFDPMTVGGDYTDTVTFTISP